MTIRSRVPLDEEVRTAVEKRLRRALASIGTHIERASVRFEDLNGPRGGIDIQCRIKVVFSGRNSVVCEERAEDAARAAARAIPSVARAARREVDRSLGKAPRPTAERRPGEAHRGKSGSPAVRDPGAAAGSVIGRRVGHAPANLEAALERPEKIRRDAYVDTAAPGTSETDRKVGGPVTARRNSKARTDGMAYALEDSRKKPSRKSTRRSSNRLKAASQLTRRAKRRARSPQARAAQGGK